MELEIVYGRWIFVRFIRKYALWQHYDAIV